MTAVPSLWTRARRALNVRRRASALREAMAAVAAGDLARRVARDGLGGAFDREAEAFNRMMDNIAAQMEEMRAAANIVAHELRTPLARLRNELDLLARNAAAAPVRARIEGARTQADEALRLFSALLRIVEVESGARRENFAAVDLAELAGACVEALEAVAGESGHRVEALLPEAVGLVGDRALLSQMIVNLVENALRHTPVGTRICLTVRRDASGCAVLEVADDGPGIAPDDRARALERFGRLGKGGAKGHGLGLPLVASIARLHGGTVALSDAAPGLKVTVLLSRFFGAVEVERDPGSSPG